MFLLYPQNNVHFIGNMCMKHGRSANPIKFYMDSRVFIDILLFLFPLIISVYLLTLADIVNYQSFALRPLRTYNKKKNKTNTNIRNHHIFMDILRYFINNNIRS